VNNYCSVGYYHLISDAISEMETWAYFNPLINGDLCPCGSGKKYGADFPEEFPANTVTNAIRAITL
jgi:SEC-C motif.